MLDTGYESAKFKPLKLLHKSHKKQHERSQRSNLDLTEIDRLPNNHSFQVTPGTKKSSAATKEKFEIFMQSMTDKSRKQMLVT